jgi:hypothetical protein
MVLLLCLVDASFAADRPPGHHYCLPLGLVTAVQRGPQAARRRPSGSRQEDWEEPMGRSDGVGVRAGSPQIRYHDEYD